MEAPNLVIFGGPNGSGKSTLALEHSKLTGLRYYGADQIAYELCSDDPSSVRIEASRKFLASIQEAITDRQSLVVESTLAGKSLRNLVETANSSGYSTTIIFTFLHSADACVDRVRQRVQLGGHDVPETDIRRRFSRAIANFWQIYRILADYWLLVYNSGTTPENVAFGYKQNTIIRIRHHFDLFQSIVQKND